jgi:hypothetical protein
VQSMPVPRHWRPPRPWPRTSTRWPSPSCVKDAASATLRKESRGAWRPLAQRTRKMAGCCGRCGQPSGTRGLSQPSASERRPLPSRVEGQNAVDAICRRSSPVCRNLRARRRRRSRPTPASATRGRHRAGGAGAIQASRATGPSQAASRRLPTGTGPRLQSICGESRRLPQSMQSSPRRSARSRAQRRRAGWPR